jgi:DNA-3-methyladenine glycosylase II
MELHATEPYDFGQSVRTLDAFEACADDRVCSEGELVVGGFADERPFVTTVRADGAGGTLDASVEWVEEAGDDRVVADWLGGFLSLADDVDPLYEAAADDPPFRRVLDALDGYHQVRFPTPFEAACWAALAAGTPLDVARQRKRELVTSVGRVVDDPRSDGEREGDSGVPAGDGDSLFLFPTPRLVLTGAPAVERLFSDWTARTLLAAAETFATEPLSTLETPELLDRLGSIWGFDAWATEFVAVHGFGRTDRPPLHDPRLRAAVEELYGLPEATDDHLDRLAERYGPHAGYWAHYLTTWAQRRDEAPTL